MLTRIYGKINFECDDCGEVLDSDTKDFDDAMGVLRAEGWRSEKLGQDWSHYCPKCGK